MSSFMASWFTSTSLFILLNLTIGTIALISRFTAPKNQPGGENPPQLLRAPSLLERVKSFNFSLYRSESSEPETLQSPYETLYRDSVPGPGPGPGSDEGSEHHVTRTKSEPNREYVEGRATPPEEWQKSASEKLAVKHTEEEMIVERQRPENQPGGENPPQLLRAPSLLERVKSFNFSLYRSESSEPETLQSPYETLDRESGPGSDEGNEHHVTRTKSEPNREYVEGRATPPEELKKSASEKLAVKHTEEEVIVERQRPATVREGKETASFGDDEEVDAKADDFINKFKQQLKLQRLDSLLRFRRSG